ncbi:hypothetical protein VZT92_001567 [Zoarces viviparus]|uniref:Uncharacterized protein n=1 Tax=Zoarces viviparus TaxID=48416 RepID=A0AAW1G592_ZOAVI
MCQSQSSCRGPEITLQLSRLRATPTPAGGNGSIFSAVVHRDKSLRLGLRWKRGFGQQAALTWPSPSRQSCPTGLKGGKGNPLIKMSLLPLTSLPP